jgi:alpha-1,3-glucosyltransferase
LLNGILFLSIACIIRGRNLVGAFLFAVLLNFKHIYLYIAPAFFFYLLRTECMSPSTRQLQPPRDGAKGKKKVNFEDEGGEVETRALSFDVYKFARLGLIVAVVFGASLGPFFWMGQAKHLKER